MRLSVDLTDKQNAMLVFLKKFFQKTSKVDVVRVLIETAYRKEQK